MLDCIEERKIMYGTLFSKVYDAFGWNFYPEEFAELLLKWMQENEIRVERMLDIGCGTGVLCHVLQEHGIKVHGMDLSEGMIEVARRNYPEIPFEQGNMITYDTPLRFDLVTSTCDAMNHILDPFDLAEVMHRVHGYLAPGGYFLFDLLKEGETAECDPEDLGEIDGTRLQFQIGRTEEGLVNLKIELFRDEVVVQTEEIRERIYSPELVEQLLRQAGFQQVWCTDQLLRESEHAATWFVIARKEE